MIVQVTLGHHAYYQEILHLKKVLHEPQTGQIGLDEAGYSFY